MAGVCCSCRLPLRNLQIGLKVPEKSFSAWCFVCLEMELANLLLAGPHAGQLCFPGCSPTAALGLANVGVSGWALASGAEERLEEQ